MEPKRVRTNATTVDDDEECDNQSSDDWDLTDYTRESTLIQNHHSTPLGSRVEVPTPPEGKVGPLEHSRLGLVGWITYWSLGNCALTVCPLTVKIIVDLIRELNLTEIVFETLTPIATKREVETYSFLFLDTPGHYCIRKYICWCNACSLVCGCR